MYSFADTYFLSQAKLRTSRRIPIFVYTMCPSIAEALACVAHTLVDRFRSQRRRHIAAAATTSSRTITLNTQYMAHKLMCLMLTRQLKMQINREPFVEHGAHRNRSSTNSTIFLFLM